MLLPGSYRSPFSLHLFPFHLFFIRVPKKSLLQTGHVGEVLDGAIRTIVRRNGDGLEQYSVSEEAVAHIPSTWAAAEGDQGP